MSAPHTNTAQPASAAERTGERVCAPASRIAGSEKARFAMEYRMPFPASAGQGSSAVQLPPVTTTKRMSSGTRNALSKLAPRIPFFSKKGSTQSAPNAIRGAACGKSASMPASIPAHGIKESASIKQPAARACLPARRCSVCGKPPYRFPRLRKKAHAAAYTKQESAKEKRYPFPPKKRTSSAPVKNPAPVTVPTRKNAVRITPILLWIFLRK